MKPGFGNGTLVMTLLRNQSMPRCIGQLVDLGRIDPRVSIGPPISTIEFGTCGSPSASMRATAASTGTEGWHTATTCTSPCRRCSIEIR